MPVKFDAEQLTAALRQLATDKPNPPVSRPTGLQNASDEWKQSEEFRVRVISARTKLKLMRDRSDALRDSLERFRTQQNSVINA